MKEKHIECGCKAVREHNPLVHCITNYVAMNMSANSLLAIGASPLMTFYANEMSEVVSKCGALMVNIGCLDDNQIEGMEAAVKAAKLFGKKWVLDPVGVGMSQIRNRICRQLIEIYSPTVVRGNATEILCLANAEMKQGKIDSSIKSEEALEAAKTLAREIGSVVVISGETDYITDGTNVEMVRNGHPMMKSVTGMGCTASAIIAAFVSVEENPLMAARDAMLLMGVAGERTAGKSEGSGSFSSAFIDELYNLKG